MLLKLVTGDRELGTGNGERRTGNGERGQRRTGNGERRTGNGNRERVRVNGEQEREKENEKRGTGNEGQESGNECTVVPRLIIQNGGRRKRRGNSLENVILGDPGEVSGAGKVKNEKKSPLGTRF